MVCTLLKTPPNLTQDAADALAVAICLAHWLPRHVLMDKVKKDPPFYEEEGIAKRYDFGCEDGR